MRLGIAIDETYDFNDFIGKSFKVVQNNDFYQQIGSIYVPSNDYESMYLSNNSITLSITGILRVKEDASSELLDEGIGYLTSLTDELLRLHLMLLLIKFKTLTLNVFRSTI